MRQLLFLLFFISIVPIAKAQLVINFENSNHTDTSYFEPDSTGLWQIGTPSKPVLNSANSLPYAILTDTLQPYPINAIASFTIKTSDCFSFSCDLKYNSDSCMDGLVIETWNSYDTIWINLIKYYDYYFVGTTAGNHNIWGQQDTCTLFNGESGISGNGTQTINGWFSVNTMFRSSWLDRKIRFRFISDSLHSGNDGFLVDNITITPFICPSSVEEINNSTFQLYPNPVTDQINIPSIPLSSSYLIFDQYGRKVLSGITIGNSIRVDGLESGIYSITMDHLNGTKSTRFVKL